MVDIANMVGLTTTNSLYIRGSSNGLIEDIESHQQEKGLTDPISERGIYSDWGTRRAPAM